MDIATILSPEKNPFWEHAQAEYFLAERDGEVVGRIGAIDNKAHGAFHPDETHVGFWGFFECENDQQTADALFAAAAKWLKARNLTVARGPASPSTNDECGLLVDGFDTPPAIMNPHNPRYYQQLVERAGFTKAMDLLCYEGDAGEGPPARLSEAAHRIAERNGVTIRTLNMKDFDAEVARVKAIYNRAWENNWGFIPMTDKELDHLAKQLKPVVVPELVVFAEKNGELIGMAVTIPDFNVALKHVKDGRLLPFGLLKILWYKNKISRARTLILGVLKEHRRSGGAELMYEQTWKAALARGIHWGEASWLLETNRNIINPMEKLGFRCYKTLRMYDKTL